MTRLRQVLNAVAVLAGLGALIWMVGAAGHLIAGAP